MARTPLMVLGCTSDAGKSFLVTALCRYLARQGESVAPFKAQNMSNNAAVCRDGAEIGRAQYSQARAAGIEPDARMNPVLLKPEADTRSQVIVMGRHDPVLSRTPWLERRPLLWPRITAAIDSLASSFDRLVIEGAGSPAEPNLMEFDLVNMAVARYTGARCYLVADIDRGGAFAHLLGTWQTLAPADRSLIGGFVLNKFRGDPALLLDAREWLQERTGVPTVALVPMVAHHLPEEDSFFLPPRSHYKRNPDRDAPGGPGHDDPGPGMAGPEGIPRGLGAELRTPSRPLRVGILLYPWASNLDEFDPLIHEPALDFSIVRHPDEVRNLDCLILPGSKSTVASLDWLRAQGFEPAIRACAERGTTILGVCGGMQVLGLEVRDPGAMEGPSRHGLGLLPLVTTMEAEKTCRQNSASTEWGMEVHGYEIHLGRTTLAPTPAHGPGGLVEHLPQGLGWRLGSVYGVYLHGICANDAWRARFIAGFGAASSAGAWQDRLAAHYDLAADLIDQSGWSSDLARW